MREITIRITNKEYEDMLILGLVQNGYEVYRSGQDDDAICFTIHESDMEVIDGHK
jgi:hypothetical protein